MELTDVNDIRNISIIGAGTMGYGIGLTFALCGYNVTLNDCEKTSLNKAIWQTKESLYALNENGIVNRKTFHETMSRINTEIVLRSAVKNADFVIETAVEDLDVKTRIFNDLDILCPQHTILASNTSSLLLRNFTSHCSRKDKVLLTHWMNPAHIIPVVEVMGIEETSDLTIELICNLLKAVHKVPIRILKEYQGLVVNRVQAAMIREVLSLWEQGVSSPEDIDQAIRGSFGFRLAVIGPLETLDYGGLDIWYSLANNLFSVISDAHRPPIVLKKLVKEGNLGFKTGKGFFAYENSKQYSKKEGTIRNRDNKFIQLLKLLYK